MGAETWLGIWEFTKAVFGFASAGSGVYYAAVQVARLAVLALASKALAPKLDLTRTALEKLITVRDPIHPQSFVYGRDMLSGPLFVANVHNTDNKDLLLGVILTGHEIDAYELYRLDDETITSSDMSAFPSGNVTSGQFANVMEIDARLGTETQAYSTLIDDAMGTLWGTAHQGKGWSYFAIECVLEENDDSFAAGAPQNLKALIRGRKVYDPRKDTTRASEIPGASGSHRVTDSTTWEWSDNPALCLADFMIDQKFGMQEETDRIDWPLCASAADICDQTVTIPSGSQSRYTCNATFKSDEDRGQVRDAILSAMMGRLVFSQGLWKMWAGAAITADVTLTEDNLAGQIQVQASAGAKERYNRVRGKFIDPDSSYQASTYPEVRSTTYETEDGGEVRSLVADFLACNDFYEAQRNAIILLKQSRQQRVVVFQGNLSCFRVQPGSVVELDISELGFNGEKFFVTEWELNEQGVSLTMVEEIDSSWSDPLTGDYTQRNRSGTLTFPDQGVPAPSSLTAATVFGGTKLSWTAPAFDNYTAIEVWSASSNSRAAATKLATVPAPATEYFDFSVEINRSRYYWIRSVNVNGQFSSWEPNLTTTTAVVYAQQQQSPIVADPFIRLGSSYWTMFTGGSYQTGLGTNSTDAIRVQTTTVATGFETDARRGPGEYDFLAADGMVVEIRVRMQLENAGVGVWSATPFVRLVVTDENETNVKRYNTTGGRQFTNTDTTGVWHDMVFVGEINNEASETPPRYLQIEMLFPVLATGPDFLVDFIDATVVGQVFKPSATSSKYIGLVPDAESASAGTYLDKDGGWTVPPGGSASNSFETWSVVSDSGFTWGSSNLVADSTTDTVSLVAGSGITLETDATLDALRITATGGGGSQTPWASDIDGAGYGLDNIDRLEIQAPGVPGDTATFEHDGIDFNTTFVNTTDWNITGITAIQAGAVDADFDAITATSYGGIPESNLLSRTVNETIGGNWTFDIHAGGDLTVERQGASASDASVIAYSNLDGVKGYAGFSDSARFTAYDAATAIIFEVDADGSLILSDVGTNADPGTDKLLLSGYGMMGSRANMYISNANASGQILFGTGDIHASGTKLTLSNSGNLYPAGASQDLGLTGSRWDVGYFNSLDVSGDIDMGANLITDTKVGQWDTAYGWGDHSTAGYLSSVAGNLGGNLASNGFDIVFADNDRATFGTGNDADIYFDAADLQIQLNPTVDFRVRGGSTSTDAMITALADGAVSLFYDGSQKVITATDGISVTGNIAVTGTVDGRDLATDGAKLDLIDDSADANQTITTGLGIDGADAGSTGDIGLSFAPQELSVITPVAADYTVFSDVSDGGGLPKKQLFGSVPLSIFNNDLGALIASNNLSDVANAATARTNLNVDVAGTDNSTDVTLAGQDYLTLSGQQITANKINVDDIANGTDGELITWSATGVATTVPVGTSGHVLTSNGPGAAPTFQAGGGGGEANQTITTGLGIDGADAGSSGDITLSFAPSELTSVAPVAADKIVFQDVGDGPGLPKTQTFSSIPLSLFDNDITKPYCVTGSGTNLTSTEATLDLSTEQISNANYSLASDQITVTEAGIYQISYTILVEEDSTTGGARRGTMFHVEIGTTPIAQSYCANYNREASGRAGAGTSFIASLSASDVLTLRGLQVGTNTDLSQGTTQMSIMKIG